nr:putative capsid [Linepithema humile virus 1]
MDDTHSIVQFLERPVQIDHFSVSATDGDQVRPLKKIISVRAQPQPYVRKYSFPSKVIQMGGKADKMENFKYFKANIRVKVVLNANPFVAGRFYLTYSPYEDQVTAARQQIYSSRAGVTAYPGVEIDVQLDNSVEIDIPYASYREAYDLTKDDTDYVTLYLFALTELMGPSSGETGAQRTGSTVVDFSIFAWFTDIDLVIPTYESLPVTLSNKQKTTTITKTIEKPLSQNDKERLVLARNLEKMKKTNKTMYEYIMNVLKPKEVSMQIQAETGKKGPIEEIAAGVGSAAGAIGGIAKKIPIIGDVVGSIADAVSTGAGIVGGIASIFGWSKPHSMDKITPLANIPGLGYTHYKGIDMGVPLALTVENELSMPTDVFPSKVDEMDLQYICSNPGVRAVIKWENTAPIGIPLRTGGGSGNSFNEGTQIVTIAPTTEEEVTIGTDKFSVCDTIPCEYVSSLFTYWRATICFKISVVKTAFHVGRLEIVFDPNMYRRKNNDEPEVDDNAYADMDTTNNYRYILDLTNETEVTIRIPYISSKQFLSTQGLINSRREWNEYDFENVLTGCLYIRPLTQLLGPETVSNYVNVIVWKWAENVDLVCPKNGRNENISIFEPMSQKFMADVKDLLPQLASTRTKREVDMQINISNKASGNEVTFFQASEDNTQALQHGAGEKISNLRVLLRTFRKLTTPLTIGAEPVVLDLQTDTEKGNDYLSYLSYMFRFFRGGVRYKGFSRDTPQQQDGRRVQIRSTLLKYGESTTAIDNGPTHTTYPDINPVHEITVPFYSQYRKLPISLAADKEVLTAALSTVSGKETVDIFRSGNDDFTFGWLVGTPQIATGMFIGAKLSEPPNGVAGGIVYSDKCDTQNWYIICEKDVTSPTALQGHPFFRRTVNVRFSSSNTNFFGNAYMIAIPIDETATELNAFPNSWFEPYDSWTVWTKNCLVQSSPGTDPKAIDLETHRKNC